MTTGYLIIFILLALFNVNDATKSMAQMKSERIASIKLEILKKLDMKEPPRLSKMDSELPDIVNEELEFGGEEDEVEKKYPSGSMARTEEIITLPLPMRTTTHPDRDLLKFKFSSQMNYISVQKSYMQLHVSRALNSTGRGTVHLAVYDMSRVHNRRRGGGGDRRLRGSRGSRVSRGSRGALIDTRPIDLSTLSIEGHWVRLNIKRHLKRFLSRRSGRQSNSDPRHSRNTFNVRIDADYPLKVNMPTAGKLQARLRPVIVTKPRDSPSRKKRSMGSCNVFISENQANNCCRLPMRINFKEMGWDNWIIRPSSYEAGTCSGECNFQVTNTDTLPHIRQLSHPRESSRSQPCCSARDTNSLKLVYYSRGFEIKVAHISDMVVNSCGCS